MLDHPHVLKLHGAVVDEDNICIVTELVPGGMCACTCVCFYTVKSDNEVICTATDVVSESDLTGIHCMCMRVNELTIYTIHVCMCA